jgi:hypothetical protein
MIFLRLTFYDMRVRTVVPIYACDSGLVLVWTLVPTFQHTSLVQEGIGIKSAFGFGYEAGV